MTQGPSSPALPSPTFVSNALGVHLPGPPDHEPFTQITSDSRKVQRGALFVALPGEKFDGHDFIDSALQSGARGIICRKDRAPATGTPVRVFAVEDVVAAYRKLAHAWRKEFNIPLIAVAGSVGKTTTKELLGAILEGRWSGRVLRTTGSQNGFVGIPMTLLELRPQHGAAVIEVGIDEVGAMAQHLPLIEANVAVLTAIGPEHLEKLIDVPTVAREEGIALSATAQRGGTVVINLDDEWIRPFMNTLRDGKKFGFTLDHHPAEPALRGTWNASTQELQIEGAGFPAITLRAPLPGRHNASNLLAAVTVAHALGLKGEEIQRGLETFRGADGRSQVRRLKDGSVVLCDYYNANPSSVGAAIDVLSGLASDGGRARWACLADMLELGPDEERFHRELSEPLIRQRVENVFLYGPRMKALEDELARRSFSGRVAHFDSHERLAEELHRLAEPGAAILIKGSRGMRMEEVYRPFATRRGDA